jgi:hypothetical protein
VLDTCGRPLREQVVIGVRERARGGW